MKRPLPKSERWKELLIIVALATLMTLVLCTECRHNWHLAVRSWGVTLLVWLVMWYGNAWVAHTVERYYSWEHSPGRRFLLGVVATVSYSTLAILGLWWFFNRALGVLIGDIWLLVWLSSGIAIVVHMVFVARYFFISWRDAALRSERLRNELLVSRYEVLKHQVNPHFIFNSLNALADLVHQDAGEAEKYIHQLARVLRYVLDAGREESVPLHQELDILQAYIFLQQIRFGDKLQLEIAVPEAVANSRVAPLVLQMLLENAIKHNEITSESPLRVKIGVADGYLVVSNNRQPRETARDDSTGTGLANIRARYAGLTRQEVRIINRSGVFKVALPLLPAAE